MKRFLLFSGQHDDPRGGIHDFKGDFDTVEDALVVVANSKWDWWHIAESTDLGLIDSGTRN